MSNPSTPNATSESGRPAVPPQSRTLGRAEPNTVNPRNFPTRGCNASSTTTAASVSGRPAAVAFNTMPKLSTTYVGGQALPNSEAEPAVYSKAMAEFVKELASYNETIEGLSRSQNRQKRSRGRGNINLIDLNPDSNPDVQHRECARSPSSQLPSPITANPNGQANQNLVLQTTNQTLAHQATQLAHQATQ
jgi:hypothetical protein